MNICLNCNKEISKRNKFCDAKCQNEYQYKVYVDRWKNGLENGMKGEYQISNHIRRYLFGKYNSKCCECGWGKINPSTGNIPLEIDHIDGNYLNNDEDNLRLLCPNCHSLTPTYKNGNTGNGRKGRKKYSC